MKTILAILCVASMAVGSNADSPPANETITSLSRSAADELAASVEQLNKLREQIAAEKLPLAQELSNLEEQLAELRRTHEKITRTEDEGKLGLTAMRAESKARQDELIYIGNLLDEYVRTFEAKLNISELQYCGEAIESAKQAAESAELSPSEKFDRQIAFVDVSQKRLFDAIGGMRFDGVGVDLEGTVAEGQFALIGPVALFRASTGSVAGLVVPQTGSTKPLIRPLEGAVQAGIASLVGSGEGLMPLDPSRGGALQALIQKTSLYHIFEKGGPIMWPLLAASVLALGTVLERIFFLMNERRKRDSRAMQSFFAALGEGDLEGAIRVSKSTKFYVVRALGYALSHRETSLANALLYAQAQELKRFQRGIPILDTVITLAPLLGLLGTVTGMMGSFSIIGGELSSPGAITGGIAEALIATAFGLGIAITALLPFNFLNARTEQARHELESAATQLELLVQPHLQPIRISDHAPTNGSRDDRGHDGGFAVREDPDRVERELRRRRELLQTQMADLRSELAEQEDQIQRLLKGRDRGLRPELVQAQPGKD